MLQEIKVVIQPLQLSPQLEVAADLNTAQVQAGLMQMVDLVAEWQAVEAQLP